MIVEDKRGNENATNRFEKTVKCEARFQSNLLRASGGVPTGRRRSLIIIVLSTFCNRNVKICEEVQFPLRCQICQSTSLLQSHSIADKNDSEVVLAKSQNNQTKNITKKKSDD